MRTDADDLTTANNELRRMRLEEAIKQKKRKITPPPAKPPKEVSPFLKIGQVLELVPVGRSSLYIMIAAGEFPKQINLSRNNVVWSRKEIKEWIDEKLSA